ncbi:probable crossover junction endonuclease EME2 [Pipistrellus kuhlii]|uniref:Structure-specific endonuclease subunit EME2 n=1 Tax=Pipistrellus kuhlii TaxID=59472 RepID=A0A7J7YWC5_PIPKU|nr:probable crossover junction endonuclease EME2 [Pipistrellus kuhlii]KAF6366129.1 essential meiotic structure-specific endonuclease subunit 2 [Pipistrellus kuhlii]
MAKVGSGMVRRSRRGRGQRRPTTWEISDSDTEGPVGAEADSEAAVRARDPAEKRRAAAEERRAAAEALRLLRPKQALRRLAVRVDPAILEDAGADILMEALGSLGCEYHIEPQRPARSLRWSRVKPEPCPRSVPPEVWAAGEQERLLLLLEPEEFLQGVSQLTQICGPACSVPWISPESPACLHLAVIGLDAYLWSRQPRAQEMQQPASPGVARAEVAVSWPEVEEALVLLQLWANLDVLLVASWQELSQHVCAFTKALAQRPFKQLQESGAFSFCTAGRWAAGERVTREGTGLRGAWWRQIRQFNRVSPAVADAVVTAFPSPRLLQQAYLACGTDQERLALLADLPVKVDGGAQPRRVGPDLSRRICLFLTSTNPDLLLDLSS